MLYQICGALFSLSLLAACGLEAQEECLPCAGNKLRQAELFLEGPAPVSGLETPLHVFRRAAGTQDGYVLDRTYASVADGEVLKLPLAELRNSDYRFLMVATRGRGVVFAGHGGRNAVRSGCRLGGPAAGMCCGHRSGGGLLRIYGPERRDSPPRRKHPPHADAHRRTGAFRYLPYGRFAFAARERRIVRCGIGD